MVAGDLPGNGRRREQRHEGLFIFEGGRWNDNAPPASHTRHEAILRLSVRHLIRSSASLLVVLLLLGARRASAQSTTTLLPDATVLPSRTFRVRQLIAWTRADELLGSGPLRNLGSTFATDSLGSQQVPSFAPVETQIRAASGLANFRLTAGQLVAVANSRVVTAPLILEYGLTRRLTLGIVVPLVEARTTVNGQLNPTLGLANVGPNPAFGSNGTTVLSQNNALISSLRHASDSLQSRVTTCQSAPTNPICSTLTGQQTAIQTLIQNTATIATALEKLYGTSATNPGLPLVPIAKDPSQVAIDGQIASLQKAYQTFLTKSVVSGSVAPATAPAANFQLQGLLASFGHDTLRAIDRSSIGDISIGATYQLANTFGDTSAAARNTLHYRLALNGTIRVGTGQPGNTNRFFDFGTGYGQHGLEAGAAADVQVNRRLSASAIGSYTLQLGTLDVARVPNAGNSAFPLGGPSPGTYSAGNVLALSLVPRFRLSGYFSLNGRYSILRTGGDQYTPGPTPPAVVGAANEIVPAVAPTAPYGTAAATTQHVGIGFSYSTVVGPDASPGRIPFEVSFSHLEMLAANGGPVAKTFREQVELRVYFSR
jgi:hypothetical protein